LGTIFTGNREAFYRKLRYYLPGIQAEMMYDHKYVVQTKGHWVEVFQ